MPNDTGQPIHPTPADGIEPPDDVVDPQVDVDDRDRNDSPPAISPTDVRETIPIDHPETDTNLDSHEIYDEGLTGATDIDAEEETDDVDSPSQH